MLASGNRGVQRSLGGAALGCPATSGLLVRAKAKNRKQLRKKGAVPDKLGTNSDPAAAESGRHANLSFWCHPARSQAPPHAYHPVPMRHCQNHVAAWLSARGLTCRCQRLAQLSGAASVKVARTVVIGATCCAKLWHSVQHLDINSKGIGRQCTKQPLSIMSSRSQYITLGTF